MARISALLQWFDRRRRWMLAASLGWVGVVVVAAGAAPGAGDDFAVPDLSAVVVIAYGVLTLIGLFQLIYFRGGRGSAQRQPPKLSLRTVLLLAAVVAAFAILFDSPEGSDDAVVDEPPPVQIERGEELVSTDTKPVEVTKTDVAALVALALIGGLALMRSRRRANAGALAPGQLEPSAEATLAPAIDDAIEQLRSGLDPRMAVLAAYASLERALAEWGSRRGAAETAVEHLARVLAPFPDVAGPAVRLGHLYEIARFSDRPISSADRHRAADELVAARDALLVSSDGTR